jgi:hypothetical protein
MRSLQIKQTYPSVPGYLQYQFQEDSWQQLVHIRNPLAQSLVYTINIDGGIAILSTDTSGILVDAEFNISRQHWKIEAEETKCHGEERADIQFVGLISKHIEIDLPVRAFTNESLSRVCFMFGTVKHHLHSCVRLSDDCVALVTGDQLRGFCIENLARL